MVNFKEFYHFSRFQRESNIFQGGPTFSRGVQLLISYRNPYNLWFSRGGSGPAALPPPSGSALAYSQTHVGLSLHIWHYMYMTTNVQTHIPTNSVLFWPRLALKPPFLVTPTHSHHYQYDSTAVSSYCCLGRSTFTDCFLLINKFSTPRSFQWSARPWINK